MKTNINLRPYNSFGFDAVAKEFVEINDANELQTLIRRGQLKNKEVLVLSGGNNILFTKEVFDGIVLYMNSKGIKRIADEDDHAILRVQAGEDWPEFVKQMVAKELHGVENLANIPGKVGAAPVQNIGAYGMELKDSFVQCEAIHLETGKKRTFVNKECLFGYRSSIFKGMLRGQYVITSVDFLLKKDAPLNMEYGNIKAYLEQNGIEKPTLQQLHDTICAIRNAKLPNVKQIGSAGSFFKNPIVSAEHYERLKAEYPDMVAYPVADGYKLAAGWLIERAGWKGRSLGRCGVYEKQALVLINLGGCTGADVIALADAITTDIQTRFGVTLEKEAIII